MTSRLEDHILNADPTYMDHAGAALWQAEAEYARQPRRETWEEVDEAVRRKYRVKAAAVLISVAQLYTGTAPDRS